MFTNFLQNHSYTCFDLGTKLFESCDKAFHRILPNDNEVYKIARKIISLSVVYGLPLLVESYYLTKNITYFNYLNPTLKNRMVISGVVNYSLSVVSHFLADYYTYNHSQLALRYNLIALKSVFNAGVHLVGLSCLSSRVLRKLTIAESIINVCFPNIGDVSCSIINTATMNIKKAYNWLVRKIQPAYEHVIPPPFPLAQWQQINHQIQHILGQMEQMQIVHMREEDLHYLESAKMGG